MKHTGSHPITETTCDDPTCWCHGSEANESVDYYQIIQQAEDAACSVRDPDLKAIAFDRILNFLLPGQRKRVVQISVRNAKPEYLRHLEAKEKEGKTEQ